ncbi:MAG: hypothetical protein V8S98_05550 [Lachnospiraceae bacterium]
MGSTSLSVKPLHLIAGFGLGVSYLSMLGIIWSVYEYFRNATIPGWSSTICIICFLSGVQLIWRIRDSGGEYLGKTYMNVSVRELEGRKKVGYEISILRCHISVLCDVVATGKRRKHVESIKTDI